MFSSGKTAARLVRVAMGVCVAAVLAGSAMAAGGDPTPPAVASKLAPGHDVSRIYSGGGKRYPIIVELAVPSLPASSVVDAASDAVRTSAIHAVQDTVLASLFGGPAAVAQASSSADYHLKRMSYTPFMALAVNAAELDKLAADPNVARIHQDRLKKPMLNQALPIIGMPNAYTAGATGAGQGVAVLDTGGRRIHDFLFIRIEQAACFSTTDAGSNATSICPGGVGESFSIDSANDCDPAVITGCSHGTHVAGIAGGFNSNLQAGEPVNGVSRDGRIVSINVFSRVTAGCENLDPGTTSCVQSFDADQLRALEYVFSIRNTTAGFKLAAVNMSLGGGEFATFCDNDALKPIIDQLRAAGIATVVAAGNESKDAAVGAPACISTAITVASSTKQDVRSDFSNWGNLIDVVAPGSQILSSYVQGNSNTFYNAIDGTSMASPMVAGAIAALKSARPQATVDQIETALKTTGLGITAVGVTKPRIRVDQALNAIPQAGAPNLVSSVAPVARATLVGNTITALATVINAGNTAGTSCSIALPAGAQNILFTYRTLNGNTFGPLNTPVNIPGSNGRQDFLMTFRPDAAMSTNLALVFDCTNSNPAPSVVGLNTFLLTGSATPVADVIATGATGTGDGILNVPQGGSNAAAYAAINIGANANLQARVSASGIGAPAATLPGSMFICQTDAQAQCLATPSATVNFTSANGTTATFTAFFNSNGTAIPFDPANKRLFVNFFQGTTPVGSASVAIRTTVPDAKAVAAANAN